MLTGSSHFPMNSQRRQQAADGIVLAPDAFVTELKRGWQSTANAKHDCVVPSAQGDDDATRGDAPGSADVASGREGFCRDARAARFIVCTMHARSLTRVCAAVVIGAAVAVATASTAWTQVRAPSMLTVKNGLHCPAGGGNNPTPAVPFSIFIAGLPAN